MLGNMKEELVIKDLEQNESMKTDIETGLGEIERAVQTNIEKSQGIQEQTGVGFHATESMKSAQDIIRNPSVEKSKRG